MRFREHRGGLAESMETVVNVAHHVALLDHIRKLAKPWPIFPPVTPETVHIKPYGWDGRIGWDTHIVVLDGYGVLGFTDEDPSGPRWLTRYCVVLMLLSILWYLWALYDGRWFWAALDGLCVMVNAGNVYFNSLPLSRRARVLRRRRGVTKV